MRLSRAGMDLEIAKPAVYRAAHSVSEGSPDVDCHVSMAKALASDAAQLVACVSRELFGTSAEVFDHDLYLWLCRIDALAYSWGSSTSHRDRFATAMGI